MQSVTDEERMRSKGFSKAEAPARAGAYKSINVQAVVSGAPLEPGGTCHDDGDPP